jgi:hypothetical protein
MEPTSGKWIVEAGELKGIARSYAAALQTYLSSRRDHRICECELRQRAWNPNTGRYQTCGARYEDPRVDGHRPGKERAS